MNSVLSVGTGLLALSFIVQVVLWRLALPRKQTAALLFLFLIVPLIVFDAAAVSGHAIRLSPAELTRAILLYVSCSLAYIVLYSAIENQSPTLAIVSHLATVGAAGCTDPEIFTQFGTEDTLSNRVLAMQQGGWVSRDGDTMRLTPQGRFYARLFQCGSSVVGLGMKGG
jgi:hypothetical protein